MKLKILLKLGQATYERAEEETHGGEKKSRGERER